MTSFVLNANLDFRSITFTSSLPPLKSPPHPLHITFCIPHPRVSFKLYICLVLSPLSFTLLLLLLKYAVNTHALVSDYISNVFHIHSNTATRPPVRPSVRPPCKTTMCAKRVHRLSPLGKPAEHSHIQRARISDDTHTARTCCPCPSS